MNKENRASYNILIEIIPVQIKRIYRAAREYCCLEVMTCLKIFKR